MCGHGEYFYVYVHVPRKYASAVVPVLVLFIGWNFAVCGWGGEGGGGGGIP